MPNTSKHRKEKQILFLTVISFILLALSAVLLITSKIREKHTYDTLDRLLDSAINNTFDEKTFDETRFSSLEMKLAKYLSSSRISSRKVADERNKIKTLVSDISHQTKTPISNILLNSELLMEYDLDAESRKCADVINEQAQKLSFLISALVKLSRLETGIMAVSPKTGDVNKLAQKLYQQYKPIASNKGLNFICQCYSRENANFDSADIGVSTDINTDINTNAAANNIIGTKASAEDNAIANPASSGQTSSKLTAVFDEKWTLEALGNIVDNAIKYTDSGSVALRTKSYEMFCCIEIADTGSGIAEDEHAQVFSRFYRGRNSGKKEGVGIGLYLARQIITQQGGYIKLVSPANRLKNQASGTVFQVYLPREAS